MFEIKNLKYKDILNIKHLVIDKGSILSIVGESGSGKTTFIKMLNNIISADEGEIFFEGINIAEINPIELRRMVVMLPQNPIIYKGTILENILIGRKFANLDGYTLDDIKNLVKLFKIDRDLYSSAENLSGGEKQRICIIRILIMNPKVILLDEPTSALDEKTEDIVMQYIHDFVKKHNKTLVMVTHSIEIAKKYSDKIIEIKGADVNEWCC